MRVGLYARISTTDKGQDINLQLGDLRAYALARRFEVFNEYVDEGVSGSKDRRPALDALLDDCRKRKVDAVLVWRLDRFGRSLKHLILALDELRALGIAFISYHENIDLSTPTGQLMFHLLASFAQFEREIIQERVRAGLKNAKAKGKRLGRPQKWIDLNILAELKKKGLTVRQIARCLSVSPSFVFKTLKNLPLENGLKSRPFEPQVEGL